MTKDEKRVLRHISLNHSYMPPKMDNYTFIDAVTTLNDKRLIKAIVYYDEFIDAKLTPRGASYLSTNPHLWNPVNLVKVAAISATIAALAAVTALFVACSK